MRLVEIYNSAAEPDGLFVVKNLQNISKMLMYPGRGGNILIIFFLAGCHHLPGTGTVWMLRKEVHWDRKVDTDVPQELEYLPTRTSFFSVRLALKVYNFSLCLFTYLYTRVNQIDGLLHPKRQNSFLQSKARLHSVLYSVCYTLWRDKRLAVVF